MVLAILRLLISSELAGEIPCKSKKQGMNPLFKAVDPTQQRYTPPVT